MRDPGLEKALAHATVTEIAELLGISQPAVSQWTRVPVEHVKIVEKLTGVPRHVLRPDIYDPPPRIRQ